MYSGEMHLRDNTINNCSLSYLRTLAIWVREGDLYRLLVDPVAHVHSSERLDESSSFKESRE
jgi:hypothetical protein